MSGENTGYLGQIRYRIDTEPLLFKNKNPGVVTSVGDKWHTQGRGNDHTHEEQSELLQDSQALAPATISVSPRGWGEPLHYLDTVPSDRQVRMLKEQRLFHPRHRTFSRASQVIGSSANQED